MNLNFRKALAVPERDSMTTASRPSGSSSNCSGILGVLDQPKILAGIQMLDNIPPFSNI